ncbi:MAG: hypothetical protein ACI9MR_000019 [Myxococcota bacterium]|jgi:hypothetical protein
MDEPTAAIVPPVAIPAPSPAPVAPPSDDGAMAALRAELAGLRVSVAEAQALKTSLATATATIAESKATATATAERMAELEAANAAATLAASEAKARDFTSMLTSANIREDALELAALKLGEADPYTDEGKAAVAAWAAANPVYLRTSDAPTPTVPAEKQRASTGGGRGSFLRALGGR